MGEKTDDLKGRAKETLGDATDDPALRREGQRDRPGAKVKGKAEDLKDKVGDVVDSVKEKVDKAVHRD